MSDSAKDPRNHALDRTHVGSGSLTMSEITAAFGGSEGDQAFPPILTEPQAASLLHVPIKTLRNWRSADRLTGVWAKPGRHVIYWRDRLVAWAFADSTTDWQP